MTSQPLFSNGDLSRYFEKRLAALRTEASTLQMEALGDEERAALDLCKKYEGSRVEVGEPSTEVDDQPPGLVVKVRVPFTGDVGLFHLRPSTYTENPPHAAIYGYGPQASLLLEYGPFGHGLESETIKQWREQKVGNIREWVGWVNHDLDSFSAQLPQVARQAVAERKALLLHQLQLRDELS